MMYLRSLILLLTLPCSLIAEPGSGRLSDGRAYRTDAEGNQIIDYIAELELEVANLKQRVNGLEVEVEERDRTIARVKSGGSLDVQSFKEKDLLTGKVQTVGKPQAQLKNLESNTSLSEAQKYQRLVAECQSERDVQNRQIAALQKKNTELQRSTGESAATVSGFQALETMNKAEQTELHEKIASLELALQEKNDALSQKDEEMHDLDVRLQQAELKAKSASKTPVAPYARTRSQETLAASSAPGRDTSLNAYKGSVKKDMVAIQRMIQERNSLFVAYRKKNGGKLSFSPKKAMSSNGRTLAQLSSLLDAASSTSEVASLQRDVREIGTFIKNDLAFIKRMSKIS